MSEETAVAHEEHVLAETDKPKNLIILGAVIVCSVGLLGIIIGVDQYFKFAVQDAITETQLKPEGTQLRALRAEEQGRLGRYQWVDRNAKVVRLPIDRAIELTLADWPNRPAGLLPAPPAPGAVAPAPAPAPVEAPKGAPAPPAKPKSK